MIDLDDLFSEVFGADVDRFLKLDTRNIGDDYGSKERWDEEPDIDDEEAVTYEDPDEPEPGEE